jgi:hypothetical protein
MAKKKDRGSESLGKLANSIAASLPDSGGEYQLSTAFSAPERRRFLGPWAIALHTVGGRPYVEAFAERALRDAALIDPTYRATYDFRESLCVKKLRISGLVDLPEGRTEYDYRMSMAISWELGRGFLLVRPELGYQSTSLGGAPAAVKEFDSSGDSIKILYRFEDASLILEEGSDFKRLDRGVG